MKSRAVQRKGLLVVVEVRLLKRREVEGKEWGESERWRRGRREARRARGYKCEAK